jgi:hypothetical protein
VAFSVGGAAKVSQWGQKSWARNHTQTTPHAVCLCY